MQSLCLCSLHLSQSLKSWHYQQDQNLIFGVIIHWISFMMRIFVNCQLFSNNDYAGNICKKIFFSNFSVHILWIVQDLHSMTSEMSSCIPISGLLVCYHYKGMTYLTWLWYLLFLFIGWSNHECRPRFKLDRTWSCRMWCKYHGWVFWSFWCSWSCKRC